jgi:hypothetical protein
MIPSGVSDAEPGQRMLRSFLARLVSEGVLGAREVDAMEDPDAGFEVRLRVQRYAYLTRPFGYDMGYRFDMYLRGPYSPELADDLAEMRPGELSGVEPAPLDGRFIALVRGKDRLWLEVAAAIMMFREDRPGLDEYTMVRAVCELGFLVSEDYVREVMRELDAALGSATASRRPLYV